MKNIIKMFLLIILFTSGFASAQLMEAVDAIQSHLARLDSAVFVQASPGTNLGHNNWLIYDKNGSYHEMVEIPQFNWDPTNGFSSTQLHPAFTVNGVRKRVFVGKYEASYLGGHAVTQAGGKVAQTINFDNSNKVCDSLNNGTTINGFHLITNAEWAAICLVSRNIMGTTEVKGNNAYGRDWSVGYIQGFWEDATDSANFVNGTSPARWLAGTGGVTTAHDGAYGIRDLNGNVWEWNKGMRLNNGEINIIPNNDAANPLADVSSTSLLWKAILQDGSLVPPGTAHTLKINAAGQISDTTSSTSNAHPFESFTCDVSVSSSCAGVALLKSLMLYATGSGLDDYFWSNTGIEAIPIRGGPWYGGAGAGLRALHLDVVRGYADYYVGFRVAFVW